MFEDGMAAYQRGDYVTALELWRPLAEQGDAKGQNGLGLMYENGQGVLRNEVQAMKWYRKAAEQGATNAQVNLAVMYVNGKGVPQDFVQAYIWFNIAAALGDEMAKQAQEKAASDMTPAQIAEAQRMAREWLAKHQQ
jgi:TPR repeat protein